MDSFPCIETGNAAIDALGRKCFPTHRDVYQAYIDLVVNTHRSSIGYLHLFDQSTELLHLTVWSQGVFALCTTSHENHYPLAEAGIWADCIRQRKTVIHNKYTSDASESGLPDGHFPVTRHMSTPIFQNGEIVGVIGIGNKPDPYTEKNKQELEQFLNLSWPVIENRLAERKQQNLKRSQLFIKQEPNDILATMLHCIGRSLELRDEYTSRHQSNVAFIAVKIAEELGLSEQRCFGLRIGASIHDIGKIAIPSQILSKPGKLHHAEFDLVKLHPELGADIFAGVELPWPVVEMINQHHERMDGSGYPHGLLGDNITIEARIIAVADTYEAMANDRPYRYAPGKEEAIKVLQEGRVNKFDPYVVDAFLTCLKKGEISKDDLHLSKMN